MILSAAELKSRTLKPETIQYAVEQIKANGYIVFESVLSPEKVKQLHKEFMTVFEAHIARHESNRGKSRTQMFLPFAEPFIDPEIITNELALPVIEALLGKDCACRYFASDTPLPGSEYQDVHSDLQALYPESSVVLPPTGLVLNIPLVDFREDTGPVEIWPGGTHMLPENDNRRERITSLADTMHSEPVLMPAGSLLIRDIRMWHRGTPNRSDAARPNLALVYFRSWFNTHPRIDISGAAYASLSERAQQLFRFEDIGGQ